MIRALRRWLAHPDLRGLDLDDPRLTALRRQVIRANPLLVKIYDRWYRQLRAVLPDGEGAVLELGAGAGYFRDFLPEAITSEIFLTPGIRAVLDATALPFSDGALRAIVMTDVFHHIPDARAFLREAARCVRPRGVVTMIEPWITPWSRWVYGRLHHEPLDEQAGWEFPSAGPLSSANLALPWIVFARDAAQLAAEFPQWRLESVRPIMPFHYLVSGGVSMRPLMPGWTFGFWEWTERLLRRRPDRWAMFAQITLRRSED